MPDILCSSRYTLYSNRMDYQERGRLILIQPDETLGVPPSDLTAVELFLEAVGQSPDLPGFQPADVQVPVLEQGLFQVLHLRVLGRTQ